MSSHRFPGKVLAPYRGEPLILHVLRAVQEVSDLIDAIVVATSFEAADDPLAAYLGQLGANIVRGPLENVFARFELCAEQFPCDWILRINADSPLLSPDILRKIIVRTVNEECDLLTTIFPRTFPKGQNVELIYMPTFEAIDSSQLTRHDLEHVTPYYYRNSEQFQIVNVESGIPELATLDLSVDTVEDLRRLEEFDGAEYSDMGFG